MVEAGLAGLYVCNPPDGGLLPAFCPSLRSPTTDPERTPVVTITVVRSGDLSIEAQVDFTTADGTVTVNSDYIGNSGTLVFPAGVDTITFQVMVINDRLVEANETVLLQLSNPVGAELGAQSDATLTILDDDGMPS